MSRRLAAALSIGMAGAAVAWWCTPVLLVCAQDGSGASVKQKKTATRRSAAGAATARSVTAAAEWPQWRGPERNGISRETGLIRQWPKQGPSLEWKATRLGEGYSSVSVAGGRVYTMGNRGREEYVIALDAANGKEVWASAIGRVRADGGGYPGPRCTPTIDGNHLFALGLNGDLVCLEAATGKLRWSKNLTKDFGGQMMSGWGYSESPLVDGDKVVCTPGGRRGTLLALNKETGTPVWQSRDFQDPAAYSSIIPAAAGRQRQYIQMTGSSVAGIAPDNGALLWRYSRQGPTAAVPTPIYQDHMVYATSGYGAGCHLIRLTSNNRGIHAEEVYANKVMVNHHGGVILIDDHVYGYSDGKGWVCQEFQSGQMTWNERSLGKGSVTFADGHLYARSEGGTVALIEASPRGYVEKGRFEQPNRSNQNAWPHPVVAGGRLYLRDQDILLCYNVQASGASEQAQRAR
jgi:outer membrane protein assembly factor BamB